MPVLGPAPRDTLCPAIAFGNPRALRFDMRCDPRRAQPDAFAAHAGFSLFRAPVHTLRLVARAFPWPLALTGAWVVCGRVWDALHAALQERVTAAEWALLCADGARREAVEQAMRRRLEEDPAGARVPLRIDWLGEETVFAGLERDDAFVQSVRLPGSEECETWVIRMVRR